MKKLICLYILLILGSSILGSCTSTVYEPVYVQPQHYPRILYHQSIYIRPAPPPPMIRPKEPPHREPQPHRSGTQVKRGGR